MIKVKVERKDKIAFVSIKGHAAYEDYGKDIVCASVSSIVTTTVNGILSFDPNNIGYLCKEGFIEIEVKKETKETEILLTNMIALLKELEKDYAKNIKVEEVSL
ncbi:MAG: ribosomal-processing cysteine protease Prp [Bacilli bacterium]|nr:ribosomal-processing cysteine protease Prp [Bacilli bacterium]